MKDFNEILTQDRTFQVRDVTFEWDDVRPEALTSFTLSENGADPEKDPNGVWKALDEQILLFIKPEQHKAWRELRAREDAPVTVGQLNAILTWLMEEQTGRPTETPSPSAPGRGRTAASSKAA